MSRSVLRQKTIGFIGAGTMGQALIQGLLAHGVPARRIVASDASARIRRAARRLRIRVVEDNVLVAKAADLIVLAVKPQQLAEVIAQLARHVTRRHLVISIAAGITLRWLEARLRGVAVIRVMPNLPATVGQGFAVMARGRHAGPSHRRLAAAIFSAAGEVVELPERHLNTVTAVSGSGPAYLFFFVQAWQDAAEALGLPPAVAQRAVRRTLHGSLRLLQAAGEPPSVLIAKVASKGGTTEAALRVLARRRVAAHLAEAIRAAARRSRALSVSDLDQIQI